MARKPLLDNIKWKVTEKGGWVAEVNHNFNIEIERYFENLKADSISKEMVFTYDLVTEKGQYDIIYFEIRKEGKQNQLVMFRRKANTKKFKIVICQGTLKTIKDNFTVGNIPFKIWEIV